MAELLRAEKPINEIEADLKLRIATCKSVGISPTLAVVRVGARPEDLSYERSARKVADRLGVGLRVHALDEFASQFEVQAVIQKVNADTAQHGLLLFRPLPTFMDEHAVCDEVVPEKDVDGMSTLSLASVFTDGSQGFPPCTADACVHMLDAYDIPIAGRNIVVVGRSLVIGKPVAMMLLRRNASVTICHSKTENLPELCRRADIVICATGRARAFGPSFFSPGQTVLDVGINFDTSGKLCGDVDFNNVKNKVGAITPVPGGIGGITTLLTFEHTVRSAERQLSAKLKGSAKLDGCEAQTHSVN